MKYKTIGRIVGLGETAFFITTEYIGVYNLITSQNLKSQFLYGAMALLSLPGIASGIADTITGAHLYLVNRAVRKFVRNEATRMSLDLELERQFAKLDKPIFGN